MAVDDFNMGAMENKSLNLFNSRLVLATPDTATDADFGRIEGGPALLRLDGWCVCHVLGFGAPRGLQPLARLPP